MMFLRDDDYAVYDVFLIIINIIVWSKVAEGSESDMNLLRNRPFCCEAEGKKTSSLSTETYVEMSNVWK